MQRGLVVNDTIVIRYQIELVVSTGGALSRHTAATKMVSCVASLGRTAPASVDFKQPTGLTDVTDVEETAMLISECH